MTNRNIAFWFLAGAIAGLISLALLVFASPGFPSTICGGSSSPVSTTPTYGPWGGGPFQLNPSSWSGGPFTQRTSTSTGGTTGTDIENLDFSTVTNGTLLSDLCFDTTTAWDVSGGLARAAIEYTGANLMTNGDFETGLAAPFDYPAPAPSIVTSPVGGGTYAMQGVACSLGCSGAAWIAAEENQIYRISLWRHGQAGAWAAGYLWDFTDSTQAFWFGIIHEGGLDVSGQYIVMTGDHLIFTTDVLFGGGPVTTDDFVFQQVKWASTRADYDFGKNYASAKVGLTLGFGQLAGVVARADTDGNGIYATLHREDVTGITYYYAELWKRVAGVWTKLQSASVAYTAGGEIEVGDDGAGNYTLFYEGAAAGPASAVAGMTGTRYGMFSASEDAVFNTFTLTE